MINSDSPAQSLQLKQITGIRVPVLLDSQLTVAGQYDFLPKEGQPMYGMSGVSQMGFVIIDGHGTIRIQRVDINFGQHAGQILQILQILEQQATPSPVPS